MTSCAKAAIRPSMDSARGFGPLGSSQADSCVGESRLDHELEVHIEDCQQQYLWAYERFQAHGNPHDRDEALLHLHRMNQAILARPDAIQAARHAAFEREIDDGVGYFSSEHAQQLGRQARAAA